MSDLTPSSDSLFSPRRWFSADDGHIRPVWRAFLFLILGFIVLLLMSGPLHPFGEGIKRGGWSAGCLLLSWMLLSVFDERSFRTLGLWFYAGWWKETLWGLLLGALLIALVAAAMLLTGVLTLQGGGAHPKLGGALASGLLLFSTAALFEEIYFRGYAFQRLIESWGAWGAVLAFSALFGFAHMSNPGATVLGTANTVLAGVLLAVAYLKTKGLWLPFGLHLSWNYFLGPVFGLPVSGGRFEPSYLQSSITGPQWLSGGNYGPEASILLTIVCAAAIGVVWKAPWIAPSPAMQDVLK